MIFLQKYLLLYSHIRFAVSHAQKVAIEQMSKDVGHIAKSGDISVKCLPQINGTKSLLSIILQHM